MGERAPKAPFQETRVGRVLVGDNCFRGYSVADDLAGEHGFWSMLSLGLGGPLLSADDCAALDDMTASGMLADPRAWPLKVFRLLAVHGKAETAMAAGQLLMRGAVVGPEVIRKSAQILLDMESDLGTDAERSTIIAWLLERYPKGTRIPGFGVPARPFDERHRTFRVLLSSRGLHRRRYWRWMEQVADAVEDALSIGPNYAMSNAAFGLDLGFDPDRIMHLCLVYLAPTMWANAVESAVLQEPLLESLPDKHVVYVGRPPRCSPLLRASKTTDR